MNGIILFQSKYGAAKKYAQWLSDETGFACTEVKNARLSEMSGYDTIILGGGIYASGIAGIGFLKKHYNELSSKKIIIYCVGASPYDEDALNEIAGRNLKGELSGIPLFYCRGAWDMNAMNAVDRNLCKMLRKAVSKKDPSEYQVWEKALMAAGDDKCDWTDKKYIAPILEKLYEI